MPSPYLAGMFDRLVAENHEAEWLGLMETNRGCPFSCCYCDLNQKQVLLNVASGSFWSGS